MNNLSLLAAVFEHAADGLVVVDLQGRIQLVNPAFNVIFGYENGDLIGTSIDRLTSGRQIPNKSFHPNALISPKEQELTGKKKDGTLFPFLLSISEVRDQETCYYVGNVHDISREKKTETSLVVEQRRNEIKSRLVSMASHEFRSPLSLIQLSTSLIERYYQRLDREKVMEHLQKIKMAIGDMTDTLNDFLSLERIESGALQPERKPFGLICFAEELVAQMQLQAGARQQIVYNHEGTDTPVVSDRNLLKHCVINLLSNAIKYSPENCLIEFKTAIRDKHYTLSISDQGIGIPKADQKKLFEAFFRASNAEALPGTGLGLYIVQNYVKQLGGQITIKSSEGLGTTFLLHFPLAKEEKVAPAYPVA